MFNLENAVREWKKEFLRQDVIEEGALADMELLLRDAYEARLRDGLEERDAFQAAAVQVGTASSIAAEYRKNRLVGLNRRLPLRPTRFMPVLLGNYLKVAWRKIRREKEYAFLNIAGLALALAVGLLTLAWAQYELSFDRFHRSADHIYRFVAHTQGEEGPEKDSGAPMPLARVLKETFPEVAEVTRLKVYPNGFWERVESPRMLDFHASLMLTDPSCLRMFDFPFIQGDPRTALNDVQSVLLTETAAKKYFGEQDPVGQRLLFTDAKIPMTVTGVLKDVPETSHLQFQMVANLMAIDVWWPDTDNRLPVRIWDAWTLTSYDMYVQLTPGSSAASLEAKVFRYLRDQRPDVQYRLSLQPLTKIHLHSADFTLFGLGDFKKSDIRQVVLFLVAALVVLLMACVNYTNLSTARSLKRAREIGIRRVNGAGRGDIIRQFLGESFLFAFAALVAAVALAAVAFPALQAISGRRLDLGLLPKGQVLLSLACVFLFTGFVSGVYPAFFLSRFAPVQALKQTVKSGRGPFFNLRQILFVAQVVCSVCLVITTAVFGFQIRFLLTKDLGFDRRNVLLVSFRGAWEQMPSFKEELLRFSGITGVTFGLEPAMGTNGHAIGSSDVDWAGRPAETRVSFDFLFADEDYLQTFGLPLAEGRFFAKGVTADKDNVVLNETAVRAMGLAEPLGKAFRMGKREGRIIGIIKDFHTSNLRTAIKPTLFFNRLVGGLSIRFDPNRMREVIGHLETTWKKFVPEYPLEYTFLEDDLEAMYRDERTTGRIVMIFSLLSLVIAGLGLFGLVSLAAEQKTKEIGIRKVLGATIMDIVRFMSREFAILVGAAIVLAWPIGYIIGSRWLSGFAYRIPLSWWIFAGSGAIVLAVAFLAMGWRSVRTAIIDPIRSLRWE